MIPARYPARTIYKNTMLLPLLVFDLYDLYIENGQAKPKQNSMAISKMLISHSYCIAMRFKPFNISYGLNCPGKFGETFFRGVNQTRALNKIVHAEGR